MKKKMVAKRKRAPRRGRLYILDFAGIVALLFSAVAGLEAVAVALLSPSLLIEAILFSICASILFIGGFGLLGLAAVLDIAAARHGELGEFRLFGGRRKR